MGVDYTAFSGYGVPLTLTDTGKLLEEPDYDIEALVGKGFTVRSWGSRGYGGDWGLILFVTSTYEDVDMRRNSFSVAKVQLATASAPQIGWVTAGHIW